MLYYCASRRAGVLSLPSEKANNWIDIITLRKSPGKKTPNNLLIFVAPSSKVKDKKNKPKSVSATFQGQVPLFFFIKT